MSTQFSGPVQVAVFDRLASDPAVLAIVGSHVYDAVPAGALPNIYVLIGEEVVKDHSDSSGLAAHHDIAISVISSVESFLMMKDAAAAITTALQAAPLSLSEGSVSAFWTRGVASRRDAAGQRKIDLKFRLRVEA